MDKDLWFEAHVQKIIGKLSKFVSLTMQLRHSGQTVRLESHNSILRKGVQAIIVTGTLLLTALSEIEI